jgi:hypothetical protein
MKDKDPISGELRKFISRHISSIEQLEILLHLFRNRDKSLSLEDITAALKSSSSSVASRTGSLVQSGLVKKESRPELFLRYDASPRHGHELVERLAEAYSTYRLRIIDLIYQPRSNVVQSIADAFKLKSEDDDG